MDTIFADEQCGGLGVMYQATNFLYCGCHKAVFWKLDGEWYHDDMLRTARPWTKGSCHFSLRLLPFFPARYTCAL
jgi:hypothetical protein